MFTTLCFSRRGLSAATLMLAGGVVLCAVPQAHAQGFLVGAQLFAANGSGASTSNGYQYDTNPSSGQTAALNITFNNVTVGKSIAFALANGSNSFSFDETLNIALSAGGGSAGALGLFFSNVNTPYNPSSSARPADLLVSRATNGSTAFFFPATGTAINNYFFSGASTYSGANSFVVGSSSITVSAYSVVDKPSGTFTLQVGPASAATPEPGSIALLAGLGISGGLFLKRRRK